MAFVDLYWREILVAAILLVTVWLIRRAEVHRPVTMLFGVAALAFAIWVDAPSFETVDKVRAVVFRALDR